MSGLGFNSKYEQLKVKRAALKEQCATLFELLAHLESVEAPAIKSDYMMRIGQLEHRVFELKTELKRWQRRFEMRQASLNRGEKPSLLAIEAALDMEFSNYMKEIEKQLEEIKKAVLHCEAEKMSEESSNEIRIAYHNAAKRLHPDLNPNLNENARNLWLQIQSAYDNQEWSKFRFLVGLIDGVVSEEKTFESDQSGMALLEKSVAVLTERSAELSKRIKEIKSKEPFTYLSLLDNPKKVAERQAQLTAQIEALEKYAREYEELWKHVK